MSEKKRGEFKFRLIADEKEYLEAEFERQDVGFFNLVVEKLLESKGVSFAAAAYDHPLKGNTVLKVRAKDAKKELHKALEETGFELQQFAKALGKATG